MTTENFPKIPKPKHANSGPTRGAIYLVTALALLLGAYVIFAEIQRAHTTSRVRNDERCQSDVQNDNLNRTRILQDLNNAANAAQAELNARWAKDVALGHVMDIPSAYEEWRLAYNEIQQEKAAQGSIVAVTALPSECRVPTVRQVATTAPTVPPPKTSPSRTPVPTSLPPLPRVTITFGPVVVTHTFTVAGAPQTVTLTATATERIFVQHTNNSTKTVTVTKTKTRPVIIITKTRTVTITCTPLLRPCR